MSIIKKLSVPHGTVAYLDVEFTDKDGEAIVPTEVEWKVVNPNTAATVKDWTIESTPAASMTLTIPSSSNKISTLPTTNVEKKETRRVVVHATFATDRELQDYYEYTVIAVYGQHT